MTRLTRLVAGLAIIGLALALFVRSARAQESQSPLTIISGDTRAHMFPTVDMAKKLGPFISDPGPLLYHSGGSVMLPKVTTYAIFWVPPTLQTHVPTGMSAAYQTIQENLLTDYPGHSLDNNNTQYFQNIGSKTYIKNAGGFGGFFVDNRAYPASGCTDAATPGNCLSDGQIQREVKHAMALKGWTGGLNHLFLVFTSSGEGSCLDNLGHCAYTFYCGYHNVITAGVPAPIVYTNQPFAETSVCQAPSEPSPNGNAAGDDAATIASHEVTEAITDPMLNAWFTAQGNEIGDLCAYDYGTLTWDASQANEMWNGNFYLLQQEYDNHVGGCVQVGP